MLLQAQPTRTIVAQNLSAPTSSTPSAISRLSWRECVMSVVGGKSGLGALVAIIGVQHRADARELGRLSE